MKESKASIHLTQFEKFQEIPTGGGITMTNNILLILVIIVAGGSWSYVMFGRGEGVAVHEKQFAAEVEKRLAENASAIETEAKALAAEVLPPLGQALYREARQDYSRYLRTIREEGEVFGNHVEEIFIEAVKHQYRDYLRQHRQVLAEEFPNHADEESLDQMVAEFEQLIDKIVERYYLKEFQREGEKSARYWARFEPLDPPVAGEPSLEQQLADYIADWSVLAFTDEAAE